MKTQNWLNYFFSVGFILLIIFLLTSMIAISRIVLTQDNSTITRHLIETNNLIQNATQIENSANNNQSQFVSLIKKNVTSINLQDFNLTSLFYINIDKNKTVVSFFLNGPLNKTSTGIYYKPTNKFSKGDLILYNNSKLGTFYSQSGNLTTIITQENQNLKQINTYLIEGRVFLINQN